MCVGAWGKEQPMRFLLFAFIASWFAFDGYFGDVVAFAARILVVVFLVLAAIIFTRRARTYTPPRGA